MHYSRREAADEAKRAGTQLERVAAGVELRIGLTPYKVPTVVYYNPLDRDEANALARMLGGPVPLAVRAGPGRAATGGFDVWLR